MEPESVMPGKEFLKTFRIWSHDQGKVEDKISWVKEHSEVQRQSAERNTFNGDLNWWSLWGTDCKERGMN